ncbi:MAG TPA: YciC family protein [bacterium]|nr:YciC family protein [bacterium]
MELTQNDNATNNAEPGALKEAFHLTAAALRVLLPRLGFFLKTALLIFVPLELLVYLANTWIPDSTGGAIFAETIDMLCLIVGEAVYLPACLYAYVKTKDNHSAPSLLPTFRFALSRFPRLFLFAVAYTLLTMVGFVLLIVPGVYWSVRYGFGAVIASARSGSLADTFAQSKALTQGRFWRVLAVAFIPICCSFILTIVVWSLFYLLLTLTLWLPFYTIGYLFVSGLFLPIPFLALVLLYERLTGEPIDLAS